MPESPPLQIIVGGAQKLLRLKSWSPEYTSGVKTVRLAGQELPSTVGGTLSAPRIRALCMGPGEWLVVSPEDSMPVICEPGFAFVDLSDGLITLAVRGSATREVLSKGCGLDLHPQSFPVGRCARTRFAQIPVILACLDSSSQFELIAARSYLHYLSSWLTDASVEFRNALP